MSFVLAMFVLPATIIAAAVVLAELSRRADIRREREGG